ncbi:hypothetical protein ACQ4PT_046879 [Festuca glaucescens]
MAPRTKRGRENARAPPETGTLPAELVLEIVARSDHRTLVRCAAICRQLRREILSPSFTHRVSQAAPRILAHLCTTDADKPLAMVHPATPSAASFCHDHLSPFISRRTARIFDHYGPVMSRHGLVLLSRLDIESRSKSGRCFDLCVYDPMSGRRTFFSKPPEIKISGKSRCKYVLLTAADGIDDSFLLLVVDPYGEDGLGEASAHQVRLLPAIFDDIVGSETTETSLHPRVPDVSIQGFLMSVWLKLPNSAAGGGGWALETVIDTEEKLRSLDPSIPLNCPYYKLTVFHCFEKRSVDVVLLRVPREGYFDTITVDLETKDIHKQEWGPSLLENDLPLRRKDMHRQESGPLLLEKDRPLRRKIIHRQEWAPFLLEIDLPSRLENMQIYS